MFARIDLGRVVAVPALICMLVLNVIRLAVDDGPLLGRAAAAVVICFYVVLAVGYLRRGRAVRSDDRPHVWLVAVGATVSPFAIPLAGGGTTTGTPLFLGTALVLLGTGGAVWAALSLGRGISVIPQARFLATGGPYRWLRHPLYVFETIASAGACLVTGGGAAWLVLALLVALQATRARWEERLLLGSVAGYEEYRSRTVGLVPSAWT